MISIIVKPKEIKRSSITFEVKAVFSKEVEKVKNLSYTLQDGGKLSPGSIHYSVVGVVNNKETDVSSVTVFVPGENKKVVLKWDAIEGVSTYRVYKDGRYVDVTTPSFEDTGEIEWNELQSKDTEKAKLVFETSRTITYKNYKGEAIVKIIPQVLTFELVNTLISELKQISNLNYDVPTEIIIQEKEEDNKE